MATSSKGSVAGKIDPSRLHLRKELKESCAKRRPSIDSVRTLAKHQYVHRYNNSEINGKVNTMATLCKESPLQVQSGNVDGCSSCSNRACENANLKENDRSVFLCNCNGEKSEGEVSKLITEDDNNGEDSKGQWSFSMRDDEHTMESYRAGVFGCKDASFVTSIRRVNKNRLNWNNCYSSGFRSYNGYGKFRKQRCRRNGVDGTPSRRIGRDGTVSLLDLTDDSADLRKAAVVSWPKLGNKGSVRSPVLSKTFCHKYGAESWDTTTGLFNDEVDGDRLDLPGCGIPCYWSRRSIPKSQIWYGSCCSPSRPMHGRRHHRHHRHWSHKRQLNSRIARHSVADTPVSLGRSSIVSGESDETNFEELNMEASSRLDGMRWSMNCSDPERVEQVETVRSISCKYRPMFFGDLIGQSAVVQSLSNAVSRRRIAPVYLFQGPRGTGKTTMARIFAAALNCLSTETKTNKPCGVCSECINYVCGKSTHFIEVDGSDKKGINSIKNLLKGPAVAHQFKVFVVDECHLFSTNKWLMFLRVLEKPVANIVFILATAVIGNMPRAVLSRCQKHIFNKISSGDIVERLQKIAAAENLDIKPDALNLIALNADGSVSDAETVMDQLSLFGKRIDIPLVNELVGAVCNQKLLDLLASAMSSNAVETVRRARELMDSGIDPMVLMSQMAGLIVDIIAGTHPISVSKRELDRLKDALMHLSNAEKHLRGSGDCSTWFTATLLQLGSVASPEESDSPGSVSRCERRNATDEDNLFREAACGEGLNEIWLRCIDKCHSKTLRQFLCDHGRLVSIFISNGGFVAQVAFVDKNAKTRAEVFLSSITNSFEIALQCNVEVRILLSEPLDQTQHTDNEDKSTVSIIGVGDKDPDHGDQCLRRLETAWMQAMEKRTPMQPSNCVKLEKNQVLPRDTVYPSNALQPRKPTDGGASRNWEDELNRELNALKLNDGTTMAYAAKRIDHSPISPSLLRSSSFASNFSPDNMGRGYESGTGAPCCSGMFSWNDVKPHEKKAVANQGACRRGRFSWF